MYIIYVYHNSQSHQWIALRLYIAAQVSVLRSSGLGKGSTEELIAILLLKFCGFVVEDPWLNVWTFCIAGATTIQSTSWVLHVSSTLAQSYRSLAFGVKTWTADAFWWLKARFLKMSVLFDQESHTIPEWSGFQPPPRTEKKTSAAPTPSGKVASAFHQLGDLEVWLRNLEDMFIHFLVPLSLRNIFQTACVSFHICLFVSCRGSVLWWDIIKMLRWGRNVSSNSKHFTLMWILAPVHRFWKFLDSQPQHLVCHWTLR